MLSCPDLTYCKRSLDFEMKDTLKKRIVDIDIHISKICCYCHLTFDNEKQKKWTKHEKPATALGRQAYQKK